MEWDMCGIKFTYNVGRKSWILQSGRGSQTTEFRVYSKFYGFLKKLSTENAKKYD